MKSLKSIKFNKNDIVLTYDNEENIGKIADWLFRLDKEDTYQIEGNTITYHYKGSRFLGCAIRDFFSKTCGCARYERFLIDKGVKIFEMMDVFIDDGKLFKITVFNGHGSIGIYGFGCWQYGRIMTFKDTEEGFMVCLRNSNMDEFRHELLFTDDIEVLIEIGEIQF